MEKQLVKQFILRKLVRRKMWLHKHTNIHNLAKGLAKQFRGSREVKEAIEDGLEVSLNPRKRKKIDEITE